VAFYAGELGITPTQLNRVCREVLGKSALCAINARLLLTAGRSPTDWHPDTNIGTS
jgi:AraC family transcriptional activator of pobA